MAKKSPNFGHGYLGTPFKLQFFTNSRCHFEYTKINYSQRMKLVLNKRLRQIK